MAIQFAQSGDGRLVLASNEVFESDVAAVVWYDSQRLIVLVFEDGSDRLMPLQVDGHVAAVIADAPDTVVVAVKPQDEEPYGYEVPLERLD